MEKMDEILAKTETARELSKSQPSVPPRPLPTFRSSDADVSCCVVVMVEQ